MKVSVRPGMAFWVQMATAVLNLAFAVSNDVGWINGVAFGLLAIPHVRECWQLAELRRRAERAGPALIDFARAYAGSKP